MNAFIGTIHAKTDEKGRVFVPALFRKILQSTGDSCLILRKDIHQNCLVLHPEKTWEEELNKLQERLLDDWSDEGKQQTFRMIATKVDVVELDSNGRILIPKKFLNDANISNSVCFVGMNKFIEIWSSDQLDKVMMNSDDLKSHVRKFLSNSRRTNEKND